MARAAAALALFLPLVTACALHGPGPLRPEPAGSVVRAYGEALIAADAETSHRLELATAHRGRDLEGQRAELAEAEGELAAVGRALVAIEEGAIRTHARIPLAGGELVLLARAPDGSWAIEGGPVGAPALGSPRDAVAALRSALLRRDLEALEALLARPTRSAWEDEVRRVIEETEDPDALRIVIEGERARVTTPDGAVIELARESEEWRVLDVRPSP